MPSDREERLRGYLEARDRALRSQLEPDERVIAAGPNVLLTDQRIVFTSLLRGDRVTTQRDTRDSLAFDELTGWAPGKWHDGRPLLCLEHVPHTRIERIPAHRFLWFRWGNATGPVVHRQTTLPFNRDSDPELLALVERLRTQRIPEREPFEVRLPGTRAERLGPSVAYLERRPARRDRLREWRARWRSIPSR
jgi:hypothetical protein